MKMPQVNIKNTSNNELQYLYKKNLKKLFIFLILNKKFIVKMKKNVNLNTSAIHCRNIQDKKLDY